MSDTAKALKNSGATGATAKEVASYRPTATFAAHLSKEQVRVVMGKHELISDHPVALGGDDAGPSPGKLLAAALASCTAVHVARLALRKGYPLEGVEVTVEFEIGHDRLEDKPVHTAVFMDNMRSRVEIKGDLSEEQLADLVFMAENCAVGNTLRRGVSLTHSVTLNREGLDKKPEIRQAP